MNPLSPFSLDRAGAQGGLHAWCMRLALLALAVGPLCPSALAQTTWVVDDDFQGTPSDCDAVGPAFGAIQAAVDQAASGDTVAVCPGTYDEQVVVATNDLVLRGAGAGSTIVRPSVAVREVIPGIPVPMASIVLVKGATGVTVSGLTVDGSAADSGAAIFQTCAGQPFYVGILYANSSGAVDGAHVTGIRSATACTIAIYARNTTGGPLGMSITRTLVEHYGIAGIGCQGQGTACTVEQNTVRGEGPVSDELQAGVLIRSEARAEIRGNVISDHFYTPGNGVPYSSVGIWLFYADPSANPHLKQTNTLVNNQVDVQRSATAAAFD